jgi:hypothetical protein
MVSAGINSRNCRFQVHAASTQPGGHNHEEHSAERISRRSKLRSRPGMRRRLSTWSRLNRIAFDKRDLSTSWSLPSALSLAPESDTGATTLLPGRQQDCLRVAVDPWASARRRAAGLALGKLSPQPVVLMAMKTQMPASIAGTRSMRETCTPCHGG